MWPVIADAFLAVLAVVIVLASDRKPFDLDVEKFKSELESQADSTFRDLIDEVVQGGNWSRLVFTDSTLSFETCQWDLPGSKQSALRELFTWVGTNRSLIRQMRIEGHADQRWEGTGCPDIGPYQDNLQLSQNRARAVYNVLLGLDPGDRLGLQPLLGPASVDFGLPAGLAYLREFARAGHLEVAGYGDRKPRDPTNPRSAKNRRVEVVLEFREDSSPVVQAAASAAGRGRIAHAAHL